MLGKANAASCLSQGKDVRVLVVDDSAVIRGFVSRWIEEEPGFAVVGAAANGREALDLLDVLRPDIVLLDLDMPVLDGVEALPQLLSRQPGLSVVVVSTLTRRNAEISLRCLALGAVDYIPKPESRREFAGAAGFRQELVFKLKGLAARHGGARPSRHGHMPAGRPRTGAAAIRSVPRVIGIGASTGGPNALAQVLQGLHPVSACLPILVVQHMPEIFTTVFAEQLAQKSGLAVAEAQDRERLQAGRVYLAPGGRHMGVLSDLNGDVAIRLDEGAPVHHCRPAVDVLFGDLATAFGRATLGLVLTGMGRDGTDGARAIVKAGGTLLVQDEASSIIWGMPGSIMKAGLAQEALALDQISGRIRRMVGVA